MVSFDARKVLQWNSYAYVWFLAHSKNENQPPSGLLTLALDSI